MNWHLAQHVHALVSPMLVFSTDPQPDIGIRPVTWQILLRIFQQVLRSLGGDAKHVLRVVVHDLPSDGSPFVCDGVVDEKVRQGTNENHLGRLPPVRLPEVLVLRHLPRLQPVPSWNNAEQRIAISTTGTYGATALPSTPRLPHFRCNFDTLSQLLQPHTTSNRIALFACPLSFADQFIAFSVLSSLC